MKVRDEKEKPLLLLTQVSGGRPPEFLSSHPADSSRVQQIEALLPTVMPLYQAALVRR